MTDRSRPDTFACDGSSWVAILWLNATFYPATLLITLIYSVVGACMVFAFAAVVRDRRRVLRLIRWIFSRYGAAIISAAWPLVRVRYVDHAPQDRQPFIVAANHRASSDAFLLAFLPFEFIQVVNIWPFRIPWLGFMAKVANYLSVREMTLEEFCAQAQKLLADGVSIAAFPEGTRSGSAQIGQFTSSIFRLALRAEVNIMPLAICGNQRVPPRGSMLLRPARIHIHKLPAMSPDECRGLTAFQLKQVIRLRIQNHLDQIEKQPTAVPAARPK